MSDSSVVTFSRFRRSFAFVCCSLFYLLLRQVAATLLCFTLLGLEILSMQTSLVASALLLAIHVSSAPAPVTPRSQYPFSQIVAFGDNLSDNGNGSVAHGVAAPGDPTNSIYGFNTWTNGPVMVSYLSGLLGVPLLDYAYGHADGGSKFGATIDNSYTQSTANAPSSKDQIANYSSSAHVASAADSLHFLWIGANDINLYHISTSLGADNSAFATSMSTMLAEQVK